jgi:hypothetical protein
MTELVVKLFGSIDHKNEYVKHKKTNAILELLQDA